MENLEYEVVDATEFPTTTEFRLPKGSLVEILDMLFNSGPNKVVRIKTKGSLIHIAQHLRNAATRKSRKISVSVRGDYIYVGRG